MKKDIHPQINNKVEVSCACGNSFTTMSTLPSITVDICSACHPFFTGQQKYVDTEGRIEKFQKKIETAKKRSETAPKKKKGKKKDTKKEVSLKDILIEARKDS